MWDYYAPDPHMRLNLGIRRRLAPLLRNDKRKITLLYSMLFTLPGARFLYYGDQIGMGDNIHLQDRNGVRTPRQWDSSPSAGFSTAMPDQLCAPVIDDEVYSYRVVNVATQRQDSGSLLNTIRHMIHVSKAHPALASGKLQWLPDAALNTLSFWRRTPSQTVLTVHNLADTSVTIKTAHIAGRTVRDILTGHTETLAATLTLQPCGFRWLDVE